MDPSYHMDEVIRLLKDPNFECTVFNLNDWPGCDIIGQFGIRTTEDIWNAVNECDDYRFRDEEEAVSELNDSEGTLICFENNNEIRAFRVPDYEEHDMLISLLEGFNFDTDEHSADSNMDSLFRDILEDIVPSSNEKAKCQPKANDVQIGKLGFSSFENYLK